MDVNKGALSPLLETIRELDEGTRLEKLCASLAQGLVRAGLDRCEVVVGLEYEDDEIATGERVALSDADPERQGDGTGTRIHYRRADYPVVYGSVRGGQPVWFPDLAQEPKLGDGERSILSEPGIVSLLVCPMVSRGQTLGFALVGRRDSDGFDESDVVVYQSLVGRAAAAIQAARERGDGVRDPASRQEMEKRLQDLTDLSNWRLEVITEIAQDISTAPQMSELFHRVVTLVKERFAYYHTHLYLLDEDGQLEMVEGYGEPGRIMKARGHRIPVGIGMVGTAAQTGQPVLSPDVSKRENWLANPLLPDTRSEVAVPIKMGGKVLGVLDVQSDQLNGLTEDDQMLLLGLCGQIAVAIQNARIVSNIQGLVEERTREVAIFQALAENATYGLLMTTPDGVVTYANRANHDLFGYRFARDAREMIGLPIASVFTPEMREQFGERKPALLAGESWQVELDGVRKDGSTFSLLMLAFGILDDQGAPIALVCINRDVTEQKQLEAERERLNKEMLIARERLISELSAPLIPITGNVLVLPLIGAVDSARAQLIMDSLLSGIESHNAEVVIVDVTGVPLMDTGVANHLLQMTNAASLVGARTILVGITPRVAQTIIELGVDLSSVTTRSNLQGGVDYALRMQGQHITAIE